MSARRLIKIRSTSLTLPGVDADGRFVKRQLVSTAHGAPGSGRTLSCASVTTRAGSSRMLPSAFSRTTNISRGCPGSTIRLRSSVSITVMTDTAPTLRKWASGIGVHRHRAPNIYRSVLLVRAPRVAPSTQRGEQPTCRNRTWDGGSSRSGRPGSDDACTCAQVGPAAIHCRGFVVVDGLTVDGSGRAST